MQYVVERGHTAEALISAFGETLFLDLNQVLLSCGEVLV
jgi:hypothetical protein